MKLRISVGRGFATTVLGFGVGILATSPLFAQSNPERNVYFGQTHVHTSWSFDAYVFGNTVTGPEEAYKYALGQPIKHPGGYMVQLKRPLDFQAVTDHAEYVGTVRLANDPGSALSKLPIADKLKVHSQDDIQKIYLFLGASLLKNEPIKELLDPQVAGSIWKETVAIADKYYQPGKFTTFAAYEWTSTPNNSNMHRNVIFKDTKKVPDVPYTSINSTHPEDLWSWMDTQRRAGNELLAISHNANLSDGIMFPLDVDSKGRPIDAAWAQDRMNNEPLSEITQLKGTSETHPSLSPNDEFANFEIFTYLLGGATRAPRIHGSYIREAYQNGLGMQDARGYNPYKFGIVGASDSHDTAVAYLQSNYFGGHGLLDATPQARLSGKETAGATMDLLSVSGLGGVWAEENTRESIFAAMQRKETFGTSGPRIKVRLFGGWDFGPDVLKQKDWVKTGYANGVPMGGDLAAPKGKAPTFVVWAVKDPDEANLDRIQIVKGWTKSGQIFEKIYDAAWSGNRVPTRSTRRSECSLWRQRSDPATGRQYGRHQERQLQEHDRRRGIEDRVDGSRLRSEPACLLLRAGAADPDPALDHLRRQDPGRSAAEQRAGDDPGSRLDIANLVHADGRDARQGAARPDRGRSHAKRRGDARRRAVARPDRRQDLQGPQYGDRSAV